MEVIADLKGLVDYHLHVWTSVDAPGVTEEGYCRRAVELGLREICFTNHWSPIGVDYTITEDEMRKHWLQVQGCRTAYPRLNVRIGLEMDYLPGGEEEVAATIARYEEIMGQPFDYVLGSIHYLYGIHFPSVPRASNLYLRYPVEGMFRDYFALVTKAVRSGLYDVMGHVDIIKKHCGDMCERYPFERYRDLAEQVVEALLDEGVGMEMNTKGLTHPVHEMNPSKPFMSLYVQRARERGLEPIITLGSDAHRHHQLGRLLSEGVDQIRACGVEKLALWRGHTVQWYRLPGRAACIDKGPRQVRAKLPLSQ
jgi:histidinol-phosphatase (PHP family)